MASSDLIDYHERSKHHVSRYAPGPPGLDWANQPDPFRVFSGATSLKLPPAHAFDLHPTEGYLSSSSVPGVPAAVQHYVSRDHALEQRALVEDPRWTSAFTSGGVVVGLSSIYWREAWKYGIRAWRYCQHDCGHAIAAVSYAAAAPGWQARLLESPGDVSPPPKHI